MSFLDCNGALVPYSYESWRDEGKTSRDSKTIYFITQQLAQSIFVLDVLRIYIIIN